MKIVEARVVVTCPGRNFVTLKVVTDEGLTGVGDATLNGRELAVAAYLQEHVVPVLVGRDPGRIEDTWQLLHRGAYFRGGPVSMTAIAAVDVALWDIKGKAAGMPVHELLGGACRDSVAVYCHATGGSVPELLDDVERHVEEGYRAVRVQAGVPGLASTYGVPKGGRPYEPADGDLPTEQVWSTPEYLRSTPAVMDAVRERFGTDVHLLHDAHHRLSPLEAAQLARSLEPHRLFWLEDPTPAEDPTAYRLVRQHSTTPLAVGEVLSSVWEVRRLLEERLIDYVRTSVVHAGGITHWLRIARHAELYGVRTGAHGATDLSPVTMAAALQVDLAVPNFGIQEHMPHTRETDEVFPHAYRYADGAMHPGDAPGLGVDLDEEAAKAFPYRRAYLPVARLRDGAVHDW